MRPPQRYSLAIEKLVYGGEGLARLPADDSGRRMAVFVPFTLPGETVSAAATSARKGLARAELVEVLQPSPGRVPAPCPYFGACGGCHLQHSSYELQLQAKHDTVRETFERAHVPMPETVSTLAAEPWQYRNRIRLQVRDAAGWKAGYLERRSHRFLAITECPIAAPRLQQALVGLSQSSVASVAPRSIRELEMFCNHDGSEMVFAATVQSAGSEFSDEFARWFASCRQAIPQLRGAIETQESGAKVTRQGDSSLEYAVNDETYRVSTGSFFQVNRHLLGALVDRVLSSVACEAGQQVWDLYAGVGLFSRPLAHAGARVTAVEAAPSSAADLAFNLRNTAATARSVTTKQYLAVAGDRPDAILLDPPRAGLGADVAEQLAKIEAPRLTYLSCDPTTLARDLQILLARGYRLEDMTMIDLFPQTFHIETLVTLRHN